MNKKFIAASLVLCGSAGAVVAQVSNTATISNHTTVRSNGHDFTNASGGDYEVPVDGVFEHNTANYTFTNDGTYNAEGSGPTYGTDKFVGTGTATIAGSVAPLFGNVSFQNRTGEILAVTNTDGIRINRTLDWSNGGIISTPRTAGGALASAVAFGANGTHTGSSATQHVDGYVGKTFSTGAFTFPVGDGAQLRDLELTVQAGDAGSTFTIAYLGGDATTLDPTAPAANYASLQTGLVSVSTAGAWDFSGPANAATMSVQISIPDMSAVGGYTAAADMRLVAYDNTTNQWVMLGTSGAGGNTAGNTLSGTIAIGKADDYTVFAIGSVSGVPLAVELTSFAASVDASCRARLEWRTDNEQGLKGFEVEYGTDGRNYRRVGEVAATNAGAYAFDFDGVEQGQGFFRLKTIDFDGSTSYSRSAQLRAACGGAGGIVVGPNPVRDEMLITGLSGESTLRVFTMSGQLVYERVVAASSARISTGDWASGSYILRISSDGGEPVVRRLAK